MDEIFAAKRSPKAWLPVVLIACACSGCWIHQRTCSQVLGRGPGIGPPTPTGPFSSAEGDIAVCPSRVAGCIGVDQESITGCGLPGQQGDGVPDRVLSIVDTVQIALTNSSVVRNLGLVDARSNVDIIRGETTVFDRGIERSEADAEWGVFDPQFTTEVLWERQDIPPGVSFSGIGSRPALLDNAIFSSGISQRLLTGGTASTSLDVDYLFNPERPPGLDPNPQYFSRLNFGLEQPLLQGAGVDVNLSNLRIAAAEADQSIWDFKREMLALVRSVETAAWELYSAERDLEAVDEVIPLFTELVEIKEALVERGLGASSDVARAKSDLLRLKQERFSILSQIAEQQLVLRNLMGLDPCDGEYLRLDLEPQLILPTEDPQSSLSIALSRRPDILRQKLAIYIAGQQRIQAKDSLRPQLNGQALWQLAGLDSNVGGSLDQLYGGDFENWQLGAQLNIPLGRRQARGNVRAAELNLLRERALLDQTSHQAASEIADAHRRLRWLFEQHAVAAERVEQLRVFRDAAKAKVESPPQGVSYDLAFEIYSRNLNNFVEATRVANRIVSEYNMAYARLEETRGTLLERRMVLVDNDPSKKVLEIVETTPARAHPVDVAPVDAQPISQIADRGDRAAEPVAAPVAAPTGESLAEVPPTPVQDAHAIAAVSFASSPHPPLAMAADPPATAAPVEALEEADLTPFQLELAATAAGPRLSNAEISQLSSKPAAKPDEAVKRRAFGFFSLRSDRTASRRDAPVGSRRAGFRRTVTR